MVRRLFWEQDQAGSIPVIPTHGCSAHPYQGGGSPPAPNPCSSRTRSRTNDDSRPPRDCLAETLTRRGGRSFWWLGCRRLGYRHAGAFWKPERVPLLRKPVRSRSPAPSVTSHGSTCGTLVVRCDAGLVQGERLVFQTSKTGSIPVLRSILGTHPKTRRSHLVTTRALPQCSF